MATELTEAQQAKRARIFGICLIPASLLMAYFWMIRPLQEAQHTGLLEYNTKGILLPPALLYMGVALTLADLRDGQFRTTGADGKPKLTKKGMLFLVGLVVVLGITYALWTAYLHSAHFQPA